MFHDGSINIRNWYATKLVFYSLWHLVKWYLMYVTYRKVFNCLITRKENNICNQFKHLEKEHSTYLNTLIQDLGETIFVYAVTLIMRFLYSRKEIVSFNVKARNYRLLKTYAFVQNVTLLSIRSDISLQKGQ